MPDRLQEIQKSLKVIETIETTGGGGDTTPSSHTFCTALTGIDTIDVVVAGIPTSIQVTPTGTINAGLYASINGVTFELIYTFTADTLYPLPYPLNNATWRLTITENSGAVTAVMS